MPSYDEFKDGYLKLLRETRVRGNWTGRADSTAGTITKNRARYEAVAKPTGVPWFWIAIAHHLEGGGDFSTHLHNGDSLSDRTHNVPAGRPARGSPPFTWVVSAIDALDIKNLRDVGKWPPSRCLYEWERFNGFGYRRRGINSPYLWSGTSAYTSGKYVSDGVFSDSAVSKQVGCVTLLYSLIAKGAVPKFKV